MRDANLLTTIGFRRRINPPKDKHPRFPFLMGVELELENVHGDLRHRGVPYWETHHDESLRNDGLEFVFEGPMYGGAALAAVDAFYAVPQDYTGGARTSTHIHVDASKLTVGAMRAIIGLSYILEDALFSSVLAARKWCGYCMPLTEMAHSRLRALLLSQDTATFTITGVKANANAEKYYGLNISSLLKHGTLEYRYFPGAPTKDELLSWMDYVTELTAAGLRLEDIEPLRGIESFEQLHNMLMTQLPTWAPRLLAQNNDKLMERLFELQGILEDEYVEPTKRIDPLLYVSPQLKGLAVRLLGRNREHRTAIAKTLDALEVLSQAEWRQQIVLGGAIKTKTGAPKKEPTKFVRPMVPEGWFNGEIVHHAPREPEIQAAARALGEAIVVEAPRAPDELALREALRNDRMRVEEYMLARQQAAAGRAVAAAEFIRNNIPR